MGTATTSEVVSRVPKRAGSVQESPSAARRESSQSKTRFIKLFNHITMVPPLHPHNKFIFVKAIRFATSQRGFPLLIMGGHRFNKWAGSKEPKIHWVCARSIPNKCRAKVTTINYQVVKAMTEHNHS